MCILRTKNVLCLNFIFAIELLLHSKILKKSVFLVMDVHADCGEV